MRLGLPHVSTVLVVVVLTKAGGKIATIFLVHRSKPSHYFFGRTDGKVHPNLQHSLYSTTGCLTKPCIIDCQEDRTMNFFLTRKYCWNF